MKETLKTIGIVAGIIIISVIAVLLSLQNRSDSQLQAIQSHIKPAGALAYQPVTVTGGQDVSTNPADELPPNPEDSANCYFNFQVSFPPYEGYSGLCWPSSNIAGTDVWTNYMSNAFYNGCAYTTSNVAGTVTYYGDCMMLETNWVDDDVNICVPVQDAVSMPSQLTNVCGGLVFYWTSVGGNAVDCSEGLKIGTATLTCINTNCSPNQLSLNIDVPLGKTEMWFFFYPTCLTNGCLRLSYQRWYTD